MSSDSGEPPDDQALVAYLLGGLSEGEAERVDELSIADDEVAWRLREVENDLVDAYVRGELSNYAREQFERAYLAGPDRKRKVEFARALLSEQIRHRGGPLAAPAPTAQGTPRAPTRGHTRWWSPLVPQWAIAAVTILAVAGAGYLVVENQRLRDEVRRAQAERAAVEQTTQGIRAALEQERSAGAAVRDELMRLRQVVPPVRLPSLRAILLLPMRRGAGDITTVTVPAGTGHVPLQLRLESDDFPHYQVAVRDPAGETVWRSSRLAATTASGGRHVEAALPAAVLRSGTYTIELTGYTANEPPELVGSYAFRIVLD